MTPQMIEKEQFPPNNFSNLNTVEMLCLGSDAQSYLITFIPKSETVSELKIALGKIWDNFLQVQLTNLPEL